MTPKSFPSGCDSNGDGWRDSLGPVFDGLPATVNDLTFQTPSDPHSNYRFNEIFTISESPWMWPNSIFSIFRVNDPLTPIWGCDCTINSGSFWPPFLSHPHPHDSSKYLHRTPNPPWRQTLRIIVLGDTSLSFRGHIRLRVMTQRSSKPKPRNPLPFHPSDMMMDPRRSPLWISLLIHISLLDYSSVALRNTVSPSLIVRIKFQVWFLETMSSMNATNSLALSLPMRIDLTMCLKGRRWRESGVEWRRRWL